MDIPLLIAILALLTWTLLPQLDRYADADSRAGRQAFTSAKTGALDQQLSPVGPPLRY